MAGAPVHNANVHVNSVGHSYLITLTRLHACHPCGSMPPACQKLQKSDREKPQRGRVNHHTFRESPCNQPASRRFDAASLSRSVEARYGQCSFVAVRWPIVCVWL